MGNIRARALVAMASGALVASCAAILGFPDRELGTLDEGGAPPSESGAPIDGAGDDGSGGDASIDCGADGALAACGAGCVDLHASPANCGACGHDCIGAACDAGACEPITLATGLGTPIAIAVADDALYVTLLTANELVRVDKVDGGAKPIAFSATLNTPWGVALEDAGAAGARVVVGEARGGGNARIFRCDPTDCAVTTDITSQNDDAIHYLVVDGTHLFWTEANAGGAGNAVMRCDVADCNNTVTTLSTASEKDAWGLTHIGGTLYWTRNSASGSVRTLPADDLATNQASPQGIANDGTRLYWANNAGNEIRTCTAAACDAGVFALSMSPAHVHVDDGIVYWTENADPGAIEFCPTTGCGAAPRVLVSGQRDPLWVAADGTAIYWTNSYNGGQVMKIAKPPK